MKKILLSLFLIGSLGFVNQAKAQCNVIITNAQFTKTGSTINYSFNWQPSGGNASLQVVLFCGTTEQTSTCIPSLKDSTVSLHYYSGSFNTTCTGTRRIEIRNYANNSCGGNSCLASVFYEYNTPLVTGFKVCSPRSITFGIKDTSATQPMTVKFLLYKDNGDNVFNVADVLLFTGTDTTLQPGASQSRFQFAYPGSTTPGENAKIWVQAVTTLGFKSEVLMEATCAPLPVNFKSFNVNRNKSTVNLVWETSSESNNKGFQVQRKDGGGDFRTIAFVNTKAKNGNSETDLTYSFTDVNNLKGVSQYRLVQEDFDGQSKFSDTRSIKGEEQSTKTIVFPNPSTNGTVNVVFEDTRSIRDIQLMDMNGRVINQWRNQTSNNIKIDNLVPGFYNLRVVDQTTKEQSIEKIIIR